MRIRDWSSDVCSSDLGGRLRSRPSATPCQREPDPAMKLQFPFMQLPIQFDDDALAREVLALDESCWRARMGGVAGNSALPLVPTDGAGESDELGGDMRPTPWLPPGRAQCRDRVG